MQVTMMSAGRQVLKNTLNGGDPGTIDSFETGLDSSIYFDQNALTASPEANYSAGTGSIGKTIVTNDEVILTCFLPYNIALSFGNIMLKLTGGIPFMWMSLPKVFIKHVINEEEHNAGDVFKIPFVIRYPSIVSKLNLSNVPDYYAQAPVSTDIMSMIDVYHSICKQQQLDNSTYTSNLGRPIYSTIVGLEYWGIPFMYSLNDTKGWQINGGEAGDGYVYGG